MDVTLPDLQAARLAAKDVRRQSFSAHPFGRELPHDEELAVYDDGRTDVDAVLVALPGSHDKMAGIPAVDVFDQVRDLPVRRILLRGLAQPDAVAHPLGGSLDEVTQSLRDLLAPHRRVVFCGASFGGFLALWFATLLEAPAVLAFGPTTTLDPAFLREIGDDRYDGVPLVSDPAWLARYADPTRGWVDGAGPHTVLHYGYRHETSRPHAERIADFPNVVLKPHFERTVMAKIRDDGSLRQDLLAALLIG